MLNVNAQRIDHLPFTFFILLLRVKGFEVQGSVEKPINADHYVFDNVKKYNR